jgi:hypothetical protein
VTGRSGTNHRYNTPVTEFVTRTDRRFSALAINHAAAIDDPRTKPRSKARATPRPVPPS